MDADGYPDEEELKRIREWPPQDGYVTLLEYVRILWRYQDYFTRSSNRYYLSTGGWSGNESLVEALAQNMVFWAMCWRLSKRGGHYEFEVPKTIVP